MHLALIALAAAAQTAPAQSIDGRWINPAKSVIIDIAPCREARCGIVQWASDKAKADAADNVPDLVGTTLLSELAPASSTQWKGRIFVPDKNIRANAKVTVVGPDQIKVSGCALGGIVCDSQVWTRASDANP